MDDRSSLELKDLRRRLRRRGLPHEYVDRVVGEMTDHHNDLVASAARPGPGDDVEGPTLGDRLGRPDHLADVVTMHLSEARSTPSTAVAWAMPSDWSAWSASRRPGP